MKIIIFFALLLSMSESKMLSHILAGWSFHLHKKCLSMTNQPSEFNQELQALVCGQNFLDLKSSDQQKKFGLIHLFVVSGSHLLLIFGISSFFIQPLLITLTLFFRKLKLPSLPLSLSNRRTTNFISLFFTFLFVCTVQFGAPALRSFFQLVTKSLFTERSFHHGCLFSALLTWLIIPTTQVFALQLSWICGLILGWPLNRSVSNYVLKSILITLLMSLFLSPLAQTSPLTLLTNLILAPFISLVLFPLGLLCLILPRAIFLFDTAMRLYAHLLDLLAADFFLNLKGQAPQISLNFIILGVTHIFLQITEYLEHHKHRFQLKKANSI